MQILYWALISPPIESDVQQKMNNDLVRKWRHYRPNIEDRFGKEQLASHVIANSALGRGLSGGD